MGIGGGFLPGILLAITTVICLKAIFDVFGGYCNLFGPQTLQISPLIPALIQTGSEWRFESTSNNNKICDCSYFSASFKNKSLPEINRGYNKVVFRKNENVVIKKIAFNGPAFIDCMDIADGNLHKEYECVEAAAGSFITEIGFMLKLQNDPSVPKLLAYCIPLDFTAHAELLASATVSGKPLDIIHLAQSDWSERVRILDEIIAFLIRSRPLLFRDFRRQQFVLIESQPTMVDFDDVISTTNSTEHEPIVDKLYSSFVDQILFATSPSAAQEPLTAIKESYSNSTLSFEKLSKITQKLRSL